MRIGILGGEGFVGWPATLHLSARGHEVVIVDSLVRRAIDGEFDAQSLTPITSPKERRDTWEQLTGRQIDLEPIDLARDYDDLKT